jgi:uncharacterized protein (TIRG00374 family)
VKHRTALVSLLAVALLVWFLRHADLSDVWQQVQRARKDLLAVALGIVVATYWARAVRWHYLLEPIGPTRFRTVMRTTVIGFAALGLLPLRLGDVLRAYLLSRQERLSMTATFATIVLERVLDLVAVLSLLAVYLTIAAGTSNLSRAEMLGTELLGVVAAVLAIGVWVVASHPALVHRLVSLVGGVLPTRMAKKLAKMAVSFSQGLVVTRRPRALSAAVVWSFAIWIIGAAEVWVVTRAFGMELPFAGSFLIQTLLVGGVAVPTPAGAGSYHEAYRWGMTKFFGASDAQAVAAAIVVHAMSFGPVIVAGLILMAQDGMSLGRLKELAREAPREEVGTNQ